MKVRQPRFDGPKKVNVIKAVEIFWQAALDAHLGGAAFYCFYGFGDQCFGRIKILGPGGELRIDRETLT